MITDPQEDYFKDGLWTWDGSRWRKQPLIFGYSDQYIEYQTDTGDGTTLNQDFSTVPSGEIWVITSFSCYPYSGAHADLVWIGGRFGGVGHAFKAAPSLAQYTSLCLDHKLILKAGDYLRVSWRNAANGDTFFSYANGYKLNLDE